MQRAEDDPLFLGISSFLMGGMFIVGIVLLAVLYPREIAYRNSQEARTCRCVGFQEVITSDGGYADMQVELLDPDHRLGTSTCQWEHLTTLVTCGAQDYSHCMIFARQKYFNQTFYCVVVRPANCDAATPPRLDFSDPTRSTGFVVGMCFVCIGGVYSCHLGLMIYNYYQSRKRQAIRPQEEGLPAPILAPPQQEEGFEEAPIHNSLDVN